MSHRYLFAMIFGRDVGDVPELDADTVRALDATLDMALTEREALVVRLRSGIATGTRLTFRVIAGDFVPRSASSVQNTEAKALRKLRHSLRDHQVKREWDEAERIRIADDWRSFLGRIAECRRELV